MALPIRPVHVAGARARDLVMLWQLHERSWFVLRASHQAHARGIGPVVGDLRQLKAFRNELVGTRNSLVGGERCERLVHANLKAEGVGAGGEEQQRKHAGRHPVSHFQASPTLFWSPASYG